MTADAGEDVEKEKHSSIAGGIANWDNHSGNHWWFLRKLEIALPKDPAIPLLGIYPRDAPLYHRDTCSTMLLADLFVI